MDKIKRELVDITFQTFMDAGLSGDNLDLLHDMVAKDVVGFGTTIHTKLFGFMNLQELVKRREEKKEERSVFIIILPDNNIMS